MPSARAQGIRPTIRSRTSPGRTAREKGIPISADGHVHLVVVSDTHSHVPFIGADRGITMFNPGSTGPRRFMPPIVRIQQVSAAAGDSVAQRL